MVIEVVKLTVFFLQLRGRLAEKVKDATKQNIHML